MEYTLEGFIKLYDEKIEIENKHINAVSDEARHYSNLVSQKRTELGTYGKELLKQHPNDKEIVCTVYAGMPLGYGNYEELSNELKNDKLVTLLALNNFDRSSYANIGDNLKSDKEVMFALAKNTQGTVSATQFSKELSGDRSFWTELLSDAYRTSSESINSVLAQIKNVNEQYNLNLDLNMIISVANEIKEIKTSPLETAYYNMYLTPHTMQNVFQGEVEKVEETTKLLGNQALNELLLSEATVAKEQKEGKIFEEPITKTEHTEATPTIENDDKIEENPTNEKAEDLKEKKELFKTLTDLKKINPNFLSDEQNKMLEELESYFKTIIKDDAESYQLDSSMSEGSPKNIR